MAIEARNIIRDVFPRERLLIDAAQAFPSLILCTKDAHTNQWFHGCPSCIPYLVLRRICCEHGLDILYMDCLNNSSAKHPASVRITVCSVIFFDLSESPISFSCTEEVENNIKPEYRIYLRDGGWRLASIYFDVLSIP